MRFDELLSAVTELLRREVEPKYSYHNLTHALRVVEAAEVIAKGENLDQQSTTLVLTAALLHDVGYIQGREYHEDRSSRWAEDNLGSYGYTAEQIVEVCRIIMSTKVPQSPTDLLSKIVCDADLASLGSVNYEEISETMIREYRQTGSSQSDHEWISQQIDFLSDHSFYTETARALFNEQKAINLGRLRSKLTSASRVVQPVDITSHSSTSTSEHIKDAMLVFFGALLASIALKDFLVPNRFFDGGVTGLSLLVHELNHWSLGALIVLFNIPPIIAAYLSAGKEFARGMLIGVILLGVCLEVLPSFTATDDKLLVSVFGGALLGIGVGLVMRAGAALDGIEVLALYTLRRTSFTIAEIILGINVMIFVIAAFSFGIETALYSILTYFTASRCIDYVVEGLEAFTGVTIISSKSEEVKSRLVNELGRGITVYKGERGFLPGSFHVSSDCDIIFTVITRLELHKLKNLISDVDPNAFIFASAIKDTSGGIIARRRKH